MCLYFYFFFFFSSRRRHTRLQGDWSSDVCSSDLQSRPPRQRAQRPASRGAGLPARRTPRLSRWPEEGEGAHPRTQDASDASYTPDRTKKEGSRGGPWSLRWRVRFYFKIPMAASAFALASAMLPALHAASASRISLAASPPRGA